MADQSVVKYGRLEACVTDVDDLDEILRLEADHENADFVLQWPREKHLELIKDDFWAHWTLRTVEEGRLVGYVILNGLNRPERIIHYNRLVISEKGKGFGREAMRLVRKAAFEMLGANRLWFDVFADNERAVALYRSEGFTQEAHLRRHEFHGGRYRDMYVFGMLKEEYRPEKSACS